ncbi:hypothetical protein [Comamonas aquatica]|uniref:hypothetical protein n=1 Tax=Comamonas aquatica TaxID=225991 RepID=UPI0012DE7C6B|nr:hypothetical protein [Comamonas aquatica]
MQKRPYFRNSITELEAIYSLNASDRSILILLSKELMHRNTPKAKALLQKVDKSLIGDGPVSPPTPSIPRKIEPDASARVAIECGHCGESNFVSVLPDIVQHLSCAHCRTSYEALYKHGVMRSKFAQKPANSSSGIPPWVWVLLAAAAVAAIYVFK